jgi:CheY-like chemotaxis protein
MSAGFREPKTRILVIEDNAADVHLLQRALASAELNCELTIIEDGAEALALVGQRGKYATFPPPDLAIVDLNLPKHSGLEVVEKMHANPHFAGVAVMILTSSSSSRERAKLEPYRVARFVTKPPDLDEFMQIGMIVRELLLEIGIIQS